MAVKKHDAKKDAPDADAPTDDADDAVDEEAGLVPKGDTATNDASDVTYEDSVGEAVESIAVPDPGAPAPITATSTPDAVQDRVLYENWVNGEAEAIAQSARIQAIDALLAGGTVEIVVHLPDTDHNYS